MFSRSLIVAAIFLFAIPAQAQIPESVKAMVDAALATGDPEKVGTIIEIAKQTNPDEAAELDRIHQGFLDERMKQARLAEKAEEREIKQAGLFDLWSGEGQIGASHSSGNSDSLGLNAAIKLKRESLRWSHRLQAVADFQRNDGETRREQFLASYEPRYQLSDKIFAYGLGQYERDRFQGFSARYAVSGGIGYHLIDREDLNFAIKAGPAFRRTEFIVGESESELAALVGLDFDWAISDGLSLTQDTNMVADAGGNAAAIVGGSNTSINVVTGLQAKVSDSISMRFSYQIEYDSNPPAGAVKTDTTSRFSLVYGF
ncbi:YdiY family protein [Altererythrobacter sp. MF3-039]|uniref:DUF481 domain-containing protein n=1 Tax=Altererythrobacter sp. MF3-039 TaxID=3252901 RepID=UPI00390C9B9A